MASTGICVDVHDIRYSQKSVLLAFSVDLTFSELSVFIPKPAALSRQNNCKLIDTNQTLNIPDWQRLTSK